MHVTRSKATNNPILCTPSKIWIKSCLSCFHHLPYECDGIQSKKGCSPPCEAEQWDGLVDLAVIVSASACFCLSSNHYKVGKVMGSHLDLTLFCWIRRINCTKVLDISCSTSLCVGFLFFCWALLSAPPPAALFHKQLCHTQLFHTQPPVTRNFVTHTHAQLFYTQPPVTRNSVTHTQLFRTPRAALSHVTFL